ncbi:hypothetical protein RRG08_023439 [Elysia crispata]|uniref:Uncharacterized protein n=1 Tax=Elysia crispata TaxID=231223 RepID=A0AAE1DX69_9GAST|nr:hypothetical protein RRG08_023439 [Elysia crispata]
MRKTSGQGHARKLLVGRANRSKKNDISIHPTARKGKEETEISTQQPQQTSFKIHKAQEGYSHKSREVKRSAPHDKRNYFEALEMEAEVAAPKGNFKEMCNITRQLSSKCRHANRPILDQEETIEKVSPTFRETSESADLEYCT